MKEKVQLQRGVLVTALEFLNNVLRIQSYIFKLWVLRKCYQSLF